jgi:hypothetical protein
MVVIGIGHGVMSTTWCLAARADQPPNATWRWFVGGITP